MWNSNLIHSFFRWLIIENVWCFCFREKQNKTISHFFNQFFVKENFLEISINSNSNVIYRRSMDRLTDWKIRQFQIVSISRIELKLVEKSHWIKLMPYHTEMFSVHNNHGIMKIFGFHLVKGVCVMWNWIFKQLFFLSPVKKTIIIIHSRLTLNVKDVTSFISVCASIDHHHHHHVSNIEM